jgi:Tol biopolymer transport system component
MPSPASLQFVPGLVLVAFAVGCDHRAAPLAPVYGDAVAVDSAGGRIAFTSNRDGNDEIYVMNADGSGVTRLTDNPAADEDPAWSPDGTRLVFTSTRDGNYDLYVMNADGSGVTRLTTDPSRDESPAWCGRRIAFESDRDLPQFPDIYVMNDDGTGVTRLTAGAAFDKQPAWSPTCDRIAFTTDPSGNVEVYVMNADGTGVTRLTNSVGYDQDPAWSPDGTRIAFTSSRDSDKPPIPYDLREIYVMNADGTGATRLTHTDASRWNWNPAWSADGSQIAFESNLDGDFEINVMNADGTGVTQLTSNTVGDDQPAWFGVSGLPPNQPPVATFTSSCSDWTCSFTSTSSDPDGSITTSSWTFGDGGTSTLHDPSHTYGSRGTYAVTLTVTDNRGATGSVSDTVTVSPPSPAGKIAFTSNRDGNPEIYVMNVDGSDVTRLTNDPGWDWWPAWSPDGTRIAFTSSRGGHNDIYVMNADGTGVTQLTTSTTSYGSQAPAWCGHKIAFTTDVPIQTAPEIYVMNDDGTEVTQLTSNGSMYDRYPSWSPTCAQIAFTKDPGGKDQIYIMNADGTDVRNLEYEPGDHSYPAWSPDGTHIAFSRELITNPGNSYEIYVINVHDSQQTRLTLNSAYHLYLSPTWSRDGSQIAFQSNNDGSPGTYVMNADGSGMTRIADGFYYNRPAWFGAGAPPPPPPAPSSGHLR